MRKTMITLLFILMLVGSAHANTVNFDSFSDALGALPAGYEGFDWSARGYYHLDSEWPGSGYDYGTVSGSYAFFNALGLGVTITKADNSIFDFNSAYLTAALNVGLNIELIGYLDSAETYSETVVVGTSEATLFNFDFLGIDTLYIHSWGGIPYYSSGASSTQFVMDDFTYTDASSVPEPSSIVLLLAGFAGLAGFGLKRRNA